MNNEIKEILDYLKKNKKFFNKQDGYLSFSYKYCDKLLDYITNLQEENQRLKELCDKYEEEHNTAFKLWKMKMEEMPTYEEKIEIQKEIERLKEENERLEKLNNANYLSFIDVNKKRLKAIKYIKEKGTTYLNLANQRKWCSEFSAENILKILEDKNNVK